MIIRRIAKWLPAALLLAHILLRVSVSEPSIGKDLIFYNAIVLAVVIGLFQAPLHNDPLAIAFLTLATASWGIGSITNLGFSSIVDQIPDSVITTGFAGVLLLAGSSMLRPPKLDEHKRMPLPVLILMSLFIGTITGLFGIGGGFLAIPVLVLYFGTPQIVAAGTSLLIIAANSLTAFIGHRSQWGDVQWHIPILMGASAIVIAQVASLLSHKTSPVVLRKAFAYLLFAISIFTLIKTYL